MAGKMSRAAWLLMMRPDRREGMESRFRDDRGREHYDSGRFAPSDWYGEVWGRSPDRRPAPVYREDVPLKGGYEMNPIGFDASREWDGSRTRMDVGYTPRNEMDHRSGHRMSGYARGEDDDVEPLTRARAVRWVNDMRGADGMSGQHWTLEQAKQIMSRHGYQDDPVEFYVALNMMMSDYVKVAQKLGCDKEEFYAALADAFLNDEDAHSDKLARYYRYIVR